MLLKRDDRGLRSRSLDFKLTAWTPVALARSAPLEEIAAFEQLQREERSSRGVSNFDVPTWKQSGRSLARPSSAIRFSTDERAIEHAVIPWCEKHGVWSPTARLVTGAFPVRARPEVACFKIALHTTRPLARSPVPGAALLATIPKAQPTLRRKRGGRGSPSERS